MNEKEFFFFKCEPTKLLNALAQMKPTEAYTYVIVLLRIYECEGPCPDLLDALSRRVGFNKRVISESLNSLFAAGRLFRTEGGIHNPKAVKVLAEMRQRSTLSAKAANQRWQKGKQKQQMDDASAMRTQCQLESESLESETLPLTQIDSASYGSGVSTLQDLERKLFIQGKEVLGKSSGGMVAHLLKATNYDINEAAGLIELAATKHDPRQFIGGVIKHRLRNHGGESVREKQSVSKAFDRIQRALESSQNNYGGEAAIQRLPLGSVRGP